VELEPWVHFIPVTEDLSDLVARVEWANANPAEAAQIAQHGLEFARANLTTTSPGTRVLTLYSPGAPPLASRRASALQATARW